MQTTWAYISNNFIYSAMGVFALSFFAHAFETAWAVKVPAEGTDARKDGLQQRQIKLHASQQR